MKEEAPGLRVRPRKDGPAYYWIAAAVVRDTRGFKPATVRLIGDEIEREARCRALTAELRLWLQADGSSANTLYRGTVKSLIQSYLHDVDSPYHAVKASTKNDYDYLLGVIERGIGNVRVEQITRAHCARWHREASAPAEDGGPMRRRRGWGVMKMLRILMNYGKSMRHAGCREVSEILAEMRIPMPGGREEALSYEQAAAIVRHGLANGQVSMAIAQALQFECSLRQIDVIGEWSPAASESGIVSREERWSGGVLWSDVSDLVLTKKTTKTAARGEWDLARCPLVMEVLAHIPADRRVGPIVVAEATGRPYRPNHYQKEWRALARACGVPDTIWNRDSRAGGITEGDEAGAAPGDLQKLATHASFATTSRYIRSTTRKATDKVLDLRAASRRKEA